MKPVSIKESIPSGNAITEPQMKEQPLLPSKYPGQAMVRKEQQKTSISLSAADSHPMPSDYYERGIEKHWVQRYWHRKRFEVIDKLLQGTNSLLLDIGCNGGLFTSKIVSHSGKESVVAMDVDWGSVLHAKQTYSIPTLVADGCYLPFKDESFDLVTCLEVLEHVPEPGRILKESSRCLKQGGCLIILVPNNTILFRLIWFFWTATWGKTWDDKHVYKFTRESVQDLLVNYSMKLVDVVTFHRGMLTAVKAIKQ